MSKKQPKKKHRSPIALLAIQKTGAGIHGAGDSPRQKQLEPVWCPMCKLWLDEEGDCDCDNE
jgi:hypothetical protein